MALAISLVSNILSYRATNKLFFAKAQLMTIEKHDLHHEFPEYKKEIHRLKMNDAHFCRFFDEYHETDNDIHRIEKSAEYTSDEILDKKKMLRLNLKDKLLMMLINERASSNEK
jgi:uncharacterized protein YdcH (DUF465 family)